MTSKQRITIFWFRRDLRLFDNSALWTALKSEFPVLPIFIFDRKILDQLSSKKDARVLFIHREISQLKSELEKIGSSLEVFYGTPIEACQDLVKKYDVRIVYANRDYEPYAKERDKEIYDFLQSQGIEFKTRKDQVIFEKDELTKDDSKPYTVLTPYSKKWKSLVNDFFLKSYPSYKYKNNFLKCPPFQLPSLTQMGFENFEFEDFLKRDVDLGIIESYTQNRDIPGIISTSRLSIHLRFGTVSIRQLCNIAILKQSEQ